MLNIRVSTRYVAVGLVLFALASTISPFGHGATLPSATVQHDSLMFTVNPDKSVGINWSTATYSSILQNQSAAFPQGYAIQSSSSFSQQSDGLVSTTSVQYTIPQQTYYTDSALALINSISLTASQTGNSTQGSLTFNATLPVQLVTILWSTSPNQINANATAQLYFSSSYNGTPLANQTSFASTWSQTLANKTWTDNIVNEIENSTDHILFVRNFNGTVTYPTSSSASVFVKFIAVPGGSAPDFLTAFENILNPLINMPTAFDNLIRSSMNLITGETVSLTYSGTARTISFKSSITFVSNLDSQLNSIKNQYFQQVLNKTGTNAPQDVFLNKTSLSISKMSMTSDTDLNAGTYSTTLSGTMISPPVVENGNNNFTMPTLFTTLGSTSSSKSGMNITLTGGSDSNNQVKVIVPTGTPTPTSTTSNSATWMNVNASKLMTVRFEVQPLPFSIIGFLTSTTGFILEGIIAVAAIAGVALFARRRRSRMSTPLTSGPTSSPGFGPSPAPPTQSQLLFCIT